MRPEEKRTIEEFARHIRIETIEGLRYIHAGHIGGSMSIADLLALLYGKVMNVDPEDPQKEDRDRLVLSKGHAGPALYAALALKGYFPKEELKTINKEGTILPSHPSCRLTPGVDMSTGCLGQGMSAGIGIALGQKMKGMKARTFIILGDGECDEGQVWEGALFAAQYGLSNIIAFVDYNHQQLDGYTEDILDLGDLRQKFEDFGWESFECDGADVEAIDACIEKASAEKPNMIILQTKKGAGCTFAEGVLFNHHMTFSDEQIDEAVTALKEGRR